MSARGYRSPPFLARCSTLRSGRGRTSSNASRAAFERDRLRHEELKLLGIEMVRVTRPRFQQEPDAVLANLAALLDRRRRELNAA